MKRTALSIALAAALPALAAGGITGTAQPGAYRLLKGAGSGATLSTHATLAACATAAAARAKLATEVYLCRSDAVVQLQASPPPAPPPAPAMPFVDVAKIPPPAAGFTDDRIRTTWFDPTGFTQDKEGTIPAPSCTGWGNGCYGNAPAPACTTDGPHCQRAPSDTPSASTIGSFRETCGFAAMKQVDPIVAPGKAKSAHMHTFFGPPGVDENTTDPRTLPSSTCAGGTVNRTVYWVPSMIDTLDGTPIAPEGLVAYYKLAYNGLLAGTLQPFEDGHRMVAGDAANAKPWGNPVRYLCVATNTWTPGIPATCPVGSELWQEIAFKQCGDGRLDSPDHSSHMADPVGGACPATHPIAHPEARYEVHYKVKAGDVLARWRLSSDMYDVTQPGGYSGHGDWFNGWKKTQQLIWLARCVNGNQDCHAALLGDGTVLY